MANEKWIVDLQLNTGTGVAGRIAQLERQLKRATTVTPTINARGVSGSFSAVMKAEGVAASNALLGGILSINAGIGAIAVAAGALWAKSFLSKVQDLSTGISGLLIPPAGYKHPAKLKAVFRLLNIELKTLATNTDMWLRKFNAAPNAIGKIGPLLKLLRNAASFSVMKGGISAGANIGDGVMKMFGQKAAQGVLASILKMSIAAGGLTVTFAGLATGIAAVGVAAVAAIPIMAGLQMTALKMAQPFLQAYASIEELRRGIAATVAEGTNLKELYKNIENLAKLPSINMEGAYQGVSGMVAAGLDPELAQAYVVAFSKISKSGEKFKSTMNAVNQILNKDVLSAEEIRTQLGDSTEGLAKHLKAEFGTMSAEKLVDMGIDPQQFIARLAQRINTDVKATASSTQSSMDNLSDSLFRLKAGLGEGLATGAIPFIERLGVVVEDLNSRGILQQLGQQLSTVFDSTAIEDTLNGIVQFAKVAGYAAQIVNDMAIGFTWVGQAIVQVIQFGLTPVTALLSWIGGWIERITGKKMNVQIDPRFTDFLSGMAGGGLIGGIGRAISGSKRREYAAEAAAKKGATSYADSLAKRVADEAKKTNTGNQAATRDRELEMAKSQLDYLREIAGNTKPEIQKMILGGGNRAAWGVTSDELANRNNPRGGGNSKFGRRVNTAMFGLLDALYDDIQRGQREANRLGWN